MESITGHRIDYDRIGALRGQQHIPSKKLYFVVSKLVPQDLSGRILTLGRVTLRSTTTTTTTTLFAP